MSFTLRTALFLPSFILTVNAAENLTKITEDHSHHFQPNTLIHKENLRSYSVAQIEPIVGLGRDENGQDYNKTIYTFTLAKDLILDCTMEWELQNNNSLKIRVSDKPFLLKTHYTSYNSDKTVSFYTWYNSLNWQKEVGCVQNKRKNSFLSQGELIPRLKHQVTLTDEQNLEVKIVVTKLKN